MSPMHAAWVRRRLRGRPQRVQGDGGTRLGPRWPTGSRCRLGHDHRWHGLGHRVNSREQTPRERGQSTQAFGLIPTPCRRGIGARHSASLDRTGVRQKTMRQATQTSSREHSQGRQTTSPGRIGMDTGNSIVQEVRLTFCRGCNRSQGAFRRVASYV